MEPTGTVCSMNSIPPFEQQSEIRWLDRIQAAVEVLLLSGLVSGFFAALPFAFRIKGSPSVGHLDIRFVIG